MDIRCVSRFSRTNYLLFVAVLMIATSVFLVTCGKDSPTKPKAPEPTPPPPPPPAPVATRIDISPTSATLNSLGQTTLLTAQVFDQNNAPMTGASLSWQSSNPGVATVTASGMVTAVSNGSAQITAKAGNASASVTVTVAQTATRVVIEPSTATLTAIGQTVQLAATVFDGNGQPVPDAVVTWQSSDVSVATVGSQGLVTAVTNGTARITAKSGGVSSSIEVTVSQSTHRITIEPQMATLTAIGETVQITATVLDRNKQPVTGAAVSWNSSDTGVATVDDEGLVTAVGSGDTRISASYDGIYIAIQVEVMISSPDRGTLIALYNALGGPKWTRNFNWLSELPLDAWDGVQTDEQGLVIKLDLGFNNLSGDIPPELGNLTSLQELNLYENPSLSCRIPPELGNLTNLRLLHIYVNPVLPAVFPPSWDPVPDPSCSIPPELGNLTNLQELRLGLDELSGSIPPELGNLTSLRFLDLGFNALSGSIPSELGNLTNLQGLGLGYNILSGSIPPELGNLTNLQGLQLGLNELSGSIPPSLGNLAKLKALDLGFNRLSGSLPEALGNLSELTYLALWYNEDLSGPLPDTFPNLDKLESLILFNTSLCVPPDDAFRAWLEQIPGRPEEMYCGEM